MTASGIRVGSVERLGDLARHAEAWDALALEGEAGVVVPLASAAWLTPHLAHKLDPGETWRCYFAYAGDRLLGVLPIVRSPHPVGRRRVPWLRVPSDHYTKDGDALLRPGLEPETLVALLDVVRHEERPFAGLRLGGVRRGSATEATLRAVGRGVVLAEPDRGARTLHIEGDGEAYWHRLGKNFRRNLRKARNRLAREGEVVHALVRDDPDGLENLARFTHVEASGWKADDGGALARSPEALAFYVDLVQSLARRGWLEWDFLDVDGRSIAAHLTARFGRTLFVVKIAYDEAFARFAPGNLLVARMLEREFESREAEVVDFVSDMEWHRNWDLEPVPASALRYYPYRPTSLLVGLAPDLLRRVLRRVPGVRAFWGRLRPGDEDALSRPEHLASRADR